MLRSLDKGSQIPKDISSTYRSTPSSIEYTVGHLGISISFFHALCAKCGQSKTRKVWNCTLTAIVATDKSRNADCGR